MKSGKQDSSVGLVGQWDITVLDDGRIKLPGDVLDVLQSSGLSSHRLWPGRMPLAKVLILCPEPLWDRWREALLSQFPSLKTHPGATAYLDPFKPIRWDAHGRISLPAPACYYAGIRKGVSLVLVGKEYCLNLWTEGEFKEAMEDCEAALARADLRQPNDEGRVQTQGGETP